MSITKEFYVELDLKQATGNRDFTLVEGDTGNIIHVTLVDDGVPVDLSDCRVLAVFTKPTGSSMQDSAIEDGGVTLGGTDGNEVTIDLFAASFGVGTNACELQIYSGAERDVLVTSAAFNFYCRNGIIDDDTVRSTDEYPLLTSLIRQVQAIEDSVLTPSDVDAALSATSENAVQNKAVKQALDGKAASSHTHTKSQISNFPTTMPPSAHTHPLAELTGVTPAAVGAIPSAEKGAVNGVAELNASAKVISAQTSSVVTEIGFSYGVDDSFSGLMVTCSAANNVIYTLSADASIGVEVEFVRLGTGTVSFAAGTGATVISVDGKLSIGSQYGCSAVKKISATTWLVTGDLS